MIKEGNAAKKSLSFLFLNEYIKSIESPNSVGMVPKKGTKYNNMIPNGSFFPVKKYNTNKKISEVNA